VLALGERRVDELLDDRLAVRVVIREDNCVDVAVLALDEVARLQIKNTCNKYWCSFFVYVVWYDRGMTGVSGLVLVCAACARKLSWLHVCRCALERWQACVTELSLCAGAIMCVARSVVRQQAGTKARARARLQLEERVLVRALDELAVAVAALVRDAREMRVPTQVYMVSMNCDSVLSVYLAALQIPSAGNSRLM
jgi:hypothetical protein